MSTAPTETSSDIVCTTREDLLYLLHEAAEVEHALMCTYLYAAFSLKSETDEGLDQEEADATRRWRAAIMGVAIEEMTHLALVSNLTCALGGRPHFARPNFPVDPGCFPSDLTARLAPFDRETVEHFVFLERPEGSTVQDSPAFAPRRDYDRGAALEDGDAVMPTAQDYRTVGALYRGIRDGLESLAHDVGEAALFVGRPAHQVGPDEAKLPGLTVVTDLASALAAVQTIIEQGEGAPSERENSHYARFVAMRDEYDRLLAKNPGFQPARPAAHDPVMRRPVRSGSKRVFIEEPLAAAVLDLANALYGEMLRCLSQAYGRAQCDRAAKSLFVHTAIDLMSSVMPLGEALTRLPANPGEHPGVNAGITFATLRSLSPGVEGAAEWALAAERLEELARRAEELAPKLAEVAALPERLKAAARRLRSREAISRSEAGPDTQDAEDDPATPEQKAAAAAGEPTEVAEGQGVAIRFNAKRCVHSRFCVLKQPHVYEANVEGEWIHPDADAVEAIVALAHECPSGAIAYERKDGGPGEPAPPVNLVQTRENGPLAFRADLRLDGVPIGYRATLCRCGHSRNKPFCDGSHVEAGFVATGEPRTQGELATLATRDGVVDVVPQHNGPLRVDGNLEVCSGTGRTALRTTQVRLCRCGQSGNKPFCDGGHARVGFVSS